jgi:predicted transcriptional regulator
MAKRGRLEIMRAILGIIKDNRNKIKHTPLLRKSGLSSNSFKEYYSIILEKELVKEITEDKDKLIVLAEKGFRFLEKYKTIVSFIEEFDL